MYLNIFSLSVQIVFLYQDPTYKFLHTEESYVGFQNQIFLYETTLMPLEIFVPLFVCSCEQHNMVRYCMYKTTLFIVRELHLGIIKVLNSTPISHRVCCE